MMRVFMGMNCISIILAGVESGATKSRWFLETSGFLFESGFIPRLLLTEAV
jgi:hypothetical protein